MNLAKIICISELAGLQSTQQCLVVAVLPIKGDLK